MKKAICHFSFHRRWDAEKWTPERLAQEVKNLGVEGVDFHVRYLGDASDAAGRIRDALSRHGRELSGLSMSNDFNKEDPREWREQIETVKKWLHVAADVKAPVCRIFGGWVPEERRHDESVRTQAQMRVLDALGKVVREAEALGVCLALENHGGLPCTGEEQVDMIRRIGSPCLKATIDVGNYLMGGQEGHVGTRIASACCAYVHFKKIPDTNDWRGWRLEPCTVGEGDVDHRACLTELRNAGYQGYVALEYEGTQEEITGVPKSVEFMNRIL